MTDKPLVLVVDDERNVRRVLATLLEQAGYGVSTAESGDEALRVVRSEDPDLVLSDLKMPGMDGLELLGRLKASFPEIPVVILTAHGTVEAAVEAMKRGAFDFMTKPFQKAEVTAIAAKAISQGRRTRRSYQGPFASDQRCGLIGRSRAIEEIRDRIEKVAITSATVLVTGETGTGKELVADAIHQLSPRRDKPLVKINCGALPENLVESELFGHAKGAFTGADRSRPGRFEIADGGTLFLDEMGELPSSSQVKLLRVLQDNVIEPVGDTRPRQVDVRLVAASHRDLEAEARDGGFREDLLYRIRVVTIHVPPLRERLDDIPLLCEFFLQKHCARLERSAASLTDEAVTFLMAQDWPGNVRELENAVERALVLCESEELGPGELSEEPAAQTDRPTGIKEASRAAADAVERRMIRAALETCGGNVTRAAEKLGLSRRGLQLKIKELGLRA